MKKILLTFLASLSVCISANASITFSGTTLFNAEIFGGQTGVYVVSNTNAFDEGLFSSLDEGLSFTQYADWSGYTVIGSSTVAAAGTSGALSTGGINFNLGGNIAVGNEVGVLVFNSSTTQTVGGDNFLIYTNDWLVPADGVNEGVTGSAAPYIGASFGSGTVVPEPSSFALLAGVFGLAWVMVRRRA